MKYMNRKVGLVFFITMVLTSWMAAQPANNFSKMGSMCGMGMKGWMAGSMMVFGTVFWILLLTLMVLAIIWMIKGIRRV